MTPLRVLISYSHDSPGHAERVLALADRLRAEGVDAWIDQYDPAPAMGWPRWMELEIERAERVLMVCTETYRRRFDGEEREGGLGVLWEGVILRGDVYRRRHDFVVPVIFEAADVVHIPTMVRDLTSYVLEPEYEKLYRHLTGQKKTPPAPVGELRDLPPARRRSFYGATIGEQEAPALVKYRVWAAGRFRHVNLLGLGHGELRLGLDEIYVSLRVAEAKAPDPSGDAASSSHISGIAGQDFAVESLLQQSPSHAVLLGAPGSGKTTALQKLHKDLAQGGAEALGLDAAMVPVYLRLRTLRPPDIKADLATWLEKELIDASGARVDAGIGKALVEHGRLLLLCDGLDEVADADLRLGWLRFLAWELGESSQSRAVISCRHGAWSRELERRQEELSAFPLYDVRPFEDGDIAALVDAWYREAAKTIRDYSREEARRAASELNDVLLYDREYADQRMKVLVSTPLFLTLLCVVSMRGREIPRRRVDFYEECVRVLLESWRQQAGRKAPASVERMSRVLESLAFFLHRHRRQEDLKEYEALLQIRRALTATSAEASAIFKWLWREAGLLSRFSSREYGFPHLGLQEHLAARYVAANPGALEGIEDFRDSWWREVFPHLASLPRPGIFGPLCRYLLDQGALETAHGLLRACLLAARELDLGPLREVLESGDPKRQLAVLQLLNARPEEPVFELVEGFLKSFDTARDAASPGEVGISALAETQISTEIQPIQASAVEEQARSLLASRLVGRSANTGFFLAHGEVEETGLLDRLAASLDDIAVDIVNARGWPAWQDGLEQAESAAAVLLLLGPGLVDEEAWHLSEIFEVPTWVVALPGEDQEPLPESWADNPRIDIPSLSLVALERAMEPIRASLRTRELRRSPGQMRGGDRGDILDLSWLSLSPREEDGMDPGSRRIRGPETKGVLGGEESGRGAGLRSYSLSVTSDEAPAGYSLGSSFTEPVTGEIFLPVAAGEFMMGGSEHANEGPRHPARCSAFWLARTPVTNRSYGRFLEVSGRDAPAYWRDRRMSHPLQPVVGVSWHDAVAYCEWLCRSSEAGLSFRLPLEKEWEFAARGVEGREYPWGDESPDRTHADFDSSMEAGPAEIGSFPAGAGPSEHLDLAGGVWEWCEDPWEQDYWRRAEGDEVGRDPGETDLRALRGGSWRYGAAYLRAAYRFVSLSTVQDANFGFRVCCVPERGPGSMVTRGVPGT